MGVLNYTLLRRSDVRSRLFIISKRLVLIVSLNFLTVFCYSQISYIYKTNPATGKLGVYRCNSGLPEVNPIYSVERNPITGYVELKQLTKDEGYQIKPNVNVYGQNFLAYEALKYKPYDGAFKGFVESFNAMNRQYYENKLQSKASLTATEQDIYFEIKEKNKSQVNNILNTFDQFKSYPPVIKDGWHKVYEIYEETGKGKEMMGDRFVLPMFVYTVANKIVKSYFVMDGDKTGFKTEDQIGFLYRDGKAIGKCYTCTKYSTLYFIDELIDWNYTLNITPGFFSITGAKAKALISEKPIPAFNSLETFLSASNCNTCDVISYTSEIIFLYPNKVYYIKCFDSDYRVWDFGANTVYSGDNGSQPLNYK